MQGAEFLGIIAAIVGIVIALLALIRDFYDIKAKSEEWKGFVGNIKALITRPQSILTFILILFAFSLGTLFYRLQLLEVKISQSDLDLSNGGVPTAVLSNNTNLTGSANGTETPFASLTQSITPSLDETDSSNTQNPFTEGSLSIEIDGKQKTFKGLGFQLNNKRWLTILQDDEGEVFEFNFPENVSIQKQITVNKASLEYIIFYKYPSGNDKVSYSDTQNHFTIKIDEWDVNNGRAVGRIEGAFRQRVNYADHIYYFKKGDFQIPIIKPIQ